MRDGLVLVLGGARSGKSRFAEKLVTESGLQPVYVATAEPGDTEMAERIADHCARRGPAWRTVDAPLLLEATLDAEASGQRALLVECLTLWLSNLMHEGDNAEGRSRALCETAGRLPGLRVLVSNEVGLGLVPDTPLGRKFRDAQGRLNQAMAEEADHVVFVAAGLPLYLKGAP
jgi:adenosylcobinamide kinase / adenosylcobinamide-phosphate guanylyltransferase